MDHVLNEGYNEEYRASKAKNQYIKINNQWLIDTSMGAGVGIFGHGAVASSIKKGLNNGSLFIVPNKITEECGELLHQATKFDKFVFCNTGSEATLRAIRIARAYTNRDKIVLFNGYWHGTHDWVLTNYSKGIPQNVKDMVITLPLREESLNRLKEKDIAIVLIEPVQSSLPIDQSKFLMKLRDICSNTGTVLCFDEVISGFRMALGGATEYFNIRPDLVTYGKIIGGGLPLGVVGGDSVMDVIKDGVRMGGTFSGNPLSMTACKNTLQLLMKNMPYRELHKNIFKLTNMKSDILQIIALGGMARLLFTTKNITTIEERDQYELSQKNQTEIITILRNKHIYINNNHAIMLSTKHTEKNIQKVIQSIESIKKDDISI